MIAVIVARMLDVCFSFNMLFSKVALRVAVWFCFVRCLACLKTHSEDDALLNQCNAGKLNPTPINLGQPIVQRINPDFGHDGVKVQYRVLPTDNGTVAVNVVWTLNGSNHAIDMSNKQFYIAHFVLTTRLNMTYDVTIVPLILSQSQLSVICLILPPGTTNLTFALSLVRADKEGCTRDYSLAIVRRRCKVETISWKKLNVITDACHAWKSTYGQNAMVSMHLHVASDPTTKVLFFHVSASNVNPYASTHVRVIEDNQHDDPPHVLAQTTSASSADGRLSVRLSANAVDIGTEIDFYAELTVNCGTSIYTEDTYMTYDYNFTTFDQTSFDPMTPAASNLSPPSTPVDVFLVVVICVVMVLAAVTALTYYFCHRRRQMHQEKYQMSYTIQNNAKYTLPAKYHLSDVEEECFQQLCPKFPESKIDSSYYVANLNSEHEPNERFEETKLSPLDDDHSLSNNTRLAIENSLQSSENVSRTSSVVSGKSRTGHGLCGSVDQLTSTLGKRWPASPVMLLYHPDNESHEHHVRQLHSRLTRAGHVVHGWSTDIAFNWRDFADRAGDTYKHIVIMITDKMCKLCATYSNGEIFKSKRSQQEWKEIVNERHGEYVPCIVLDKLRTIYQEHRREFMVHAITFREQDVTLLDTFVRRYSLFLTESNTLKYCLHEHDIRH